MIENKDEQGMASKVDLREIAKLQKGIILCILANIIMFVARYMDYQVLYFYLGIAVVGFILVFLLATKLFGSLRGVLLTMLTVVPLIGMISLLIVNGKATDVLKQHNIKVGLLGANLSKL